MAMQRRRERHRDRQGGKRPLLIIATVVCVAVMVFSAGMLIRYALEYAEGDALYEELGNARKEGVETSNPVVPTPGTDNPGQEENPDPDAPETIEVIPVPDAIAGMQIDFESLQEINPDVIGWLYCPDTVIDYPVVQGEDNSYYLTHLYDGKKNSNGSIFMDYRGSADFSDVNTLIYGHHMKNGKMFASLEGYKKQVYYDAHPALYLFTPDGNYEIQVFAGIVQSGQTAPPYTSFSDEAQYLELLASLNERSTFKSDVEVPVFAQLITLMTCTYDYQDARYYLVGKLVKVGAW
jgi:sortase B